MNFSDRMKKIIKGIMAKKKKAVKEDQSEVIAPLDHVVNDPMPATEIKVDHTKRILRIFTNQK